MNIEKMLEILNRNIRWLSEQTNIPYATLYDLIKSKSVEDWKMKDLIKLSCVFGIDLDKLYIMIRDKNNNIRYYPECYCASQLMKSYKVSEKSECIDKEKEELHLIIAKLVHHICKNNSDTKKKIDEIIKKGDACKADLVYKLSYKYNISMDEVIRIIRIYSKYKKAISGKRTVSDIPNIPITREEALTMINKHNYHKRRKGYISKKEIVKFYNGEKNLEEFTLDELKIYAMCFGLSNEDLYERFNIKQQERINMKSDEAGQYRLDI